MSIPTSREEFRDFCMRKLGWPVIEINVDLDQVEDRIDEALHYYRDYHFDGSETIYYKHQLEAKNFPDRVATVDVTRAGLGYSNSDTVAFGSGSGTIVTDSAGAILQVVISDHGSEFKVAPAATITTSTGMGAQLAPQLGGWITLPENIMGAVRIFDLSSSFVSDNMFSIQYQIALNDMYTLTSQSMVPFYMTMTQLSLIQQILIGKQPIRYSRHRNRLHIDMNWDRVKIGDYVIVEGYEAIDPVVFTDVWKDRWLTKYVTAQIKLQWGSHMKKLKNVPLAGGVTLDGQQIYDEAVAEIEKMEQEMIDTYSLPSAFYTG